MLIESHYGVLLYAKLGKQPQVHDNVQITLVLFESAAQESSSFLDPQYPLESDLNCF